MLKSILNFCFIWVSLTVANSAKAQDLKPCEPGTISVNHQCVPIGNEVTFSFSQVFSVSREYKPTWGSPQMSIIVSGNGFAGHLGGSFQSPIPLTITLIESGQDEWDSLLESCHQAAILNLSGNNKYDFSVNVAAVNPSSYQTDLLQYVIFGGDGKFAIHNERSDFKYLCGNSLKSE